MSYTKDMRRDRIKKIITYLSLLFLLCLLVACGQQEETTDDGVTYFHHSIADRNTGIITEQAPVFMTNTETGHL